jgi:protein involved in polysaccharide export with SLBB domain
MTRRAGCSPSGARLHSAPMPPRLRALLAAPLLLLALGRPAAGQGADVLRPGDRLTVTLRDTVHTVTIRTDGRAVLPVIGPLAVAGLGPTAAEDSVTRAYAAFSRRVDLQVTALRRVTVQGSVQRADVFYVDATIGLAEALALAGGITEDGHRGKVDLFRAGALLGRYDSRTPATLDVPLRSGDLILVRQRSWWARNPAILVSLATSLVTIVALTTQ